MAKRVCARSGGGEAALTLGLASRDVKSRCNVLEPVDGFARVVLHRFDGELGYLVDSAQLEDEAVVEGAENSVECEEGQEPGRGQP